MMFPFSLLGKAHKDPQASAETCVTSLSQAPFLYFSNDLLNRGRKSSISSGDFLCGTFQNPRQSTALAPSARLVLVLQPQRWGLGQATAAPLLGPLKGHS